MYTKGNILAVYQSPHASTKKVAESMIGILSDNGYNCENIDLKLVKNGYEDIIHKIADNYYEFIIIGTPVYLDHILKPVKDFIKSISKLKKKSKTILFTTYGAVSTGVAIPEMFRLLKKRNFDIIGVINVVSEHTLMFQGGNPLGGNCPNEDDLKQVKKFMNSIIEREKEHVYKALKLNEMPKKPFWYKIMTVFVFRMNILGRTFPPIVFDPLKCNKCGTCKTVCSIKMLPNEEIQYGKSKGCLRCYECVRNCPQHAVHAALEEFEWKIYRKKRIVDDFESFNTDYYI